jgi:DNA-binding CsgD family transcriptional regulator
MNTTPLAALPELIDHRAQLHGRLREGMESSGAASLQGVTTIDRLLGRQAESDLIASFLAAAADTGRGLLIVGQAGVGKTALLSAAADAAVAAGTRVLRAEAVEFEADVSFSGLNQALMPLVAEFDGLAQLHREALIVALGLGEGSPPDRLVVSNAALSVLRQAAQARPLLLVVDDLQWLDRASADVLSFVARRLSGSRVGFLAAARSGPDRVFEGAGIPTLEVGPLDAEAASALLRMRFPSLAPGVRKRLLAEAGGNPLALLELPAALSDGQQCALQSLPVILPLTDRLHVMFASRVADLSAATRRLLLLAVLDGTGELGVLRAASGDPGLGDLLPAERARLVHVDEDRRRVLFRHPLTRSAIIGLSTRCERHEAHRALAETRVDQPDRRAWHLAEATDEPDEQVAALLEQTARRLLAGGDAVGAAMRLDRAADLSPGSSDRGRRLTEAAFVGVTLAGGLEAGARLLTKAREAEPELGPRPSLQAATTSAFLLLNGHGDMETAHRLLVGAIEANGRYDATDDALTSALHVLFSACWFGQRADLWQSLQAILDRLTPAVPADLLLLSQTYDPARTPAAALNDLDAAIRSLEEETDPWRIRKIALAAYLLDRFAGCRPVVERILREARETDAVTVAVVMSVPLCSDDFGTGRWCELGERAEDALMLCERHGLGLYVPIFRYHQALLAAVRGEDAQVRALTDELSLWAATRGAGLVTAFARHARGLAAIGRGDFEEAYQHAAAISPPGVLAEDAPQALWSCMDLVEAAMRTGRHAGAAAHVAALRAAGVSALSARLDLLVRCSEAMATTDHAAAIDRFAEALAIPGIERWPFDLARVHLAFGERLRRAREPNLARTQLAAALGAFERLQAHPWVVRAGNELRATGQAPAPVQPRWKPFETLTVQELEIATLAATGLTNKQIGERLYLSHRTVASHLYRSFPKLGIATRSALRDALSRYQAV